MEEKKEPRAWNPDPNRLPLVVLRQMDKSLSVTEEFKRFHDQHKALADLRRFGDVVETNTILHLHIDGCDVDKPFTYYRCVRPNKFKKRYETYQQEDLGATED